MISITASHLWQGYRGFVSQNFLPEFGIFMRVQMRTMRQILNANGILLDGIGHRFPVRFDLTETQDFYAEWPGPHFSYGDFHFGPEFDRSMLPELEQDSALWLSAPGFAAQVHLQGERFTVVRLREEATELKSSVFAAA